MFRRATGLVVLVLALASAAPVRAAPSAVEAGRTMAKRDCSQCHNITPGGGGSWTSAPSFQSIADRPGQTAAAISAYLQKRHVQMLRDNRPKPEADAIAAYIASLREK
ncbi:MAG: hypothetical protein JSR21_18975 [Proteobacteria bacterium]|nr:hypothetical protein [Pseudomonadota bacterium]